VTLTIHKEEDDQRQLKVRVEVDEKRVEQAMRETARQLARDIHIPGFRRGKAPYGVVLRRFGREAVRAEAVEEIAPKIFEEVLEETEADIYAQANMDDMKLEPLVLEFTIPLSPTVKLGDYRAIRKELEPVEVTDEALQAALEHVRSHHEIVEPVERPVEVGDRVTLSGRGELVENETDDEEEILEAEEPAEETIDEIETAGESEEVDPGAASDEDDEEWEEDWDDEEWEEYEELEDEDENVIFDYENIDLVMNGEQLFFGQVFVDNIVGMSVGEEKTFTITFPDDFEDKDYAGRQATFNVSVLNVQSRTLPPLDDELAKQEGNYETLAELEEALRTELKEQAESSHKDALLEGMIDDLLEGVEAIVYPPAAVEHEIDGIIENYKDQVTRSGWEWEEYLLMQGQEEEEVREEFRETAEKRLRRQLVMRQFLLDEKLRVRAEDIDALIEERIGRFDDEKLREGMRDYYRQGAAFDMLSSEVLMEKMLERIEAVVTGNAPDLAELEAEAEETAIDEEE
jgi:trigger factor